MMTGGINCPNDNGEMTLRRIKKETTFKGESISYQYETYVCEKCDINIGTLEQTAAAQNAIADAYREKVGLLTGEEIKRQRAKRNWSQRELAKEAGVGIASIKRWENGVIQTKPMNQALKSAFQGVTIGNRYTGNRAAISIPRIKIVLKALEKEVGEDLLVSGDMLLFAAKYLWYADMLAFKRLGRSITGSTYAALPYGPQLNNYVDLVELIKGADESEAEPLTDEEKSIIVRVAVTFPNRRMVYDASHREEVWKSRSPGEIIPYTAAEDLTEI
jgi:putative zinc finger/helix-turn-helix YgiT family protein